MVGYVAPVRAVPGRSRDGTRCRRCLSEIETLPHILGFCPYSEALRNIRHHAVRSMLAEALKEVGFTVHQEVQGLATQGSVRRIDIIAIKNNSAYILDPTIRFETHADQPHEVDSEKKLIYEPTISFYKDKYSLSHIDVIGLMVLARDDLQIYIKFHTDEINDAVTKINDDLDSIWTWTRKFRLKLNPEKSQSIIVGHSRLLSTITIPNLSPIKKYGTEIPFNESVKNQGKCQLHGDFHQLTHADYENSHRISTPSLLNPADIRNQTFVFIIPCDESLFHARDVSYALRDDATSISIRFNLYPVYHVSKVFEYLFMIRDISRERTRIE
ncbi:hypothetical protein ANN_07075 [Periplaneta americana]|uniref:Reverse transcriptase n=1 Tax=Periplaneta americana TaxID=6978 RepID=A0ABQ8TFX9_PERAM|nr:hypothetical protein ANN_07075 [Periplaneta americana]